MILTTPILTKINTFDPALNTSIKFAYSGGQIQKKRLLITNSSTSEIILDETQNGMQLAYSLAANSLTPGQYLAQIQVFDFDNNESELSDPVLFYCYTTPVLEFNGLTSVLNQANITLSVTYSQEQNDTLSEFAYYLYDRDKILLSQSPTMYSILDYTFYGLKDQHTYYVRCFGTTTKGMVADTGYFELNIQYVMQPNNVLVKLTNNSCEGYISIDCNIIDIGYEIGGTAIYAISNGEVMIEEGTYVSYNSGFNFSDDFSIFIKAKKVPLDRNFFVMESESGIISLSIINIAGDYYCKLSTESALDSYNRYVVFPNAYEVNGEITTNNIVVFEVRRKNNLYSLSIYNEN